VDGTNNPCIQSVFFESFPIYTAHFGQNGQEVVLGSRHSAFFCYDMIAGKLINVPRIKGGMACLISEKNISTYCLLTLSLLMYLVRAFCI